MDKPLRIPKSTNSAHQPARKLGIWHDGRRMDCGRMGRCCRGEMISVRGTMVASLFRDRGLGSLVYLILLCCSVHPSFEITDSLFRHPARTLSSPSSIISFYVVPDNPHFSPFLHAHLKHTKTGIDLSRQYPKALKLRGGGLDLHGHMPVPLERTLQWLNATTFDGSEVQSPWSTPWDPEDYTKDELLWMAAEINDGAAVGRLVEAGADINSANDYNQTALHKAAMMGHDAIYALGALVSLGADLFIRDFKRFSALDYAREMYDTGFGPEQAVLLLEQAMSVVSGQSVSMEEESEHNDANASFPVVLTMADGRIIPAPPPRAEAAEATGKRENDDNEEDINTAEKGKKKKKKKRYGSAKERWKALKDHRKKKSAKLRGEL